MALDYHLNHLRELESESIYVLREVAAQFENPCILFSGGKDSIVVTHLAMKAFYPANIPFTLLHVDTGHNFQEALDFRDQLVEKNGLKLIVASVQEAIDKGLVREEKGYNASRNALQTVPLLEAIEKNKFDCAIGGARRDEESAAAARSALCRQRDDGAGRGENGRRIRQGGSGDGNDPHHARRQ